MIFLGGLFFPIDRLTALLRPVPFDLPITYGTDVLHGVNEGRPILPIPSDPSGPCPLLCCAFFRRPREHQPKRDSLSMEVERFSGEPPEPEPELPRGDAPKDRERAETAADSSGNP